MITKSEVTRTIHQRVHVLTCSVCLKEFDFSVDGERLAEEHAKFHTELIYLRPGNKYCDTVWLEKECLLDGEFIQHRNRGRTAVNWAGPGWYLFREYEWQSYCGTRREQEFKHVDVAYAELREELREKASELSGLRAIQKEPKP